MHVNRKTVEMPRLGFISDLVVRKNRGTVTLQQECVLVSMAAHINPFRIVFGIGPICHLCMGQHDDRNILRTRKNLLVYRPKTLRPRNVLFSRNHFSVQSHFGVIDRVKSRESDASQQQKCGIRACLGQLFRACVENRLLVQNRLTKSLVDDKQLIL